MVGAILLRLNSRLQSLIGFSSFLDRKSKFPHGVSHFHGEITTLVRHFAFSAQKIANSVQHFAFSAPHSHFPPEKAQCCLAALSTVENLRDNRRLPPNQPCLRSNSRSRISSSIALASCSVIFLIRTHTRPNNMMATRFTPTCSQSVMTDKGSSETHRQAATNTR